MKNIAKSTVAVLAGSVALSGAIAPAVSAWGDNAGGRKSYTVEQINAGALGNQVIFNTISNSVLGDEKNFVSALESTADPKGTWKANDITVEDGKEYVIRLYAHNNNPNGWNGVSTGTKVAFSLPQNSSKDLQVNGFINSANATPSKYWDYVNFHADQAFHLEYVYGSAVLYNKGIGKGDNGVKLGDEIVTNVTGGGALIGFNKLDGVVPGCYGFDNIITIRVKAVYDANFTVSKKVRIEGTKEWKESVEAKVGDRVEYQIEYTNTSKETQTGVKMKDVLPTNMKYVAGTTKLWNANHKGAVLTPDGNLVGNGINIGSYTAGSNAFVRFTAEVVDKTLACGSNTLVNWGQAGIGDKTVQDNANVVVNKVCNTPTELPSTGPEAIVGGVVATGSIVTAAGYFIASRKALR